MIDAATLQAWREEVDRLASQVMWSRTVDERREVRMRLEELSRSIFDREIALGRKETSQ